MNVTSTRPRLQRPDRELVRTAEQEGSAARVVTHYTEQHSQALDVLGEFTTGNEQLRSRASTRAKGPRVVMPRPGEGLRSGAERRTARNKILAFFGAMALVLLLGVAFKPRAVVETADARPADVAGLVAFGDPSTSSGQATGAELQVGEHTFTEVAPEQSALVTAPGEQRMAKLSHYWPPLGGVNCATFRDGQCVSNMASGLPWWAWVGRAAACPVELPFWSTITLPGGETFVCLDRGSKVVTTAAGELWVDLLVETPPVPYGTAMPVTVRYPWSEGQ